MKFLLNLLLIVSVFSVGHCEESPADIARQVRLMLDERLLQMPQKSQREEISLRLCQDLTSDAGPAARIEEAINRFEFEEARAQLLESRKLTDAALVRVRFRWLLLTEDYSHVDSLTAIPAAKAEVQLEYLLARAELKYRLLQYEEAMKLLDSMLEGFVLQEDVLARRALIRGKIYYKLNKPGESLTELLSGFTAEGLFDDVIYNTGLTLIRLGRANDAIAIFEETLNWNPLHEGAHYFLGNGYARLNYAQLADSVGARLDSAAALVKIASDAWSVRDYGKAIEECKKSLAMVPAYGRAHNCLAKALEGQRMLVSVNRAGDERIFEETPTPTVAGIEQYVANWNALTPRHQKQVALAVKPWEKYVPLLVECGSRHYIKPLHERLSECPNLTSLKDQRISYDSRLWDDVRGCGGFTTVTGIEDVERSIYFAYNTVLHELTHQVHGCFPPEDLQMLEDAFQSARLLDDGGTATYMSRYQASSVWEYFAEGANAYYSPKRNAFDTREIVRERLLAMDTILVRLVEMFIAAPHLEACWPVGLCNAADDAVEKPDLDLALQLATKAQQRAPQHEVVWATLSRLHSLRNEHEQALAFSDSLVRNYPEVGRSYLRMAEAMRTAKANCGDERIALLQMGLMGTDTSDRERVFQAIGDACDYEGKYEQAREAYAWILERHPTDYAAHWGMASAYGTDEKAGEHYENALAERTGIAALRCDYARYLYRTGRDDEGRKQLEEAKLLAPKDGMVLTIMAMDALAKREWSQAIQCCDQALETAAAPRLAAILKAKALSKSGKKREAEKLLKTLRAESKSVTPQWVYDPLISNFTTKNEWPAELKTLLANP